MSVYKHKILTPCIIILGLLYFISCSENKEYLLVIDTSGSMVTPRDIQGQKVSKSADGLPTLDRIKGYSVDFVKQLNDGDSVQVLHFDSVLNKIISVKIQSDADRQAILGAIDSLQAKGAYTDMWMMIEQLQEHIKKNNADNKKVIIVLSDGKDDPPPGSRNGIIDLDIVKNKEQTSKEKSEASKYFIYYISLGKIKDPTLATRLKKLSSNDVKTISRSSNPNGNQDKNETLIGANENPLTNVNEDLESKGLAQQLRYWGMIILAVLSAIFLLLLLYWLIHKFLNRNSPKGALKYYDATMGKFSSESKSLEKIEKSNFTIGSKSGVDFKIRDLGVKSLKMKSGKKSGKPVLQFKDNLDKDTLKYITQARPGFISQGDQFKLGNFIIEYINGKD